MSFHSLWVGGIGLSGLKPARKQHIKDGSAVGKARDRWNASTLATFFDVAQELRFNGEEDFIRAFEDAKPVSVHVCPWYPFRHIWDPQSTTVYVNYASQGSWFSELYGSFQIREGSEGSVDDAFKEYARLVERELAEEDGSQERANRRKEILRGQIWPKVVKDREEPARKRGRQVFATAVEHAKETRRRLEDQRREQEAQRRLEEERQKRKKEGGGARRKPETEAEWRTAYNDWKKGLGPYYPEFRTKFRDNGEGRGKEQRQRESGGGGGQNREQLIQAYVDYYFHGAGQYRSEFAEIRAEGEARVRQLENQRGKNRKRPR